MKICEITCENNEVYKIYGEIYGNIIEINDSL